MNDNCAILLLIILFMRYERGRVTMFDDFKDINCTFEELKSLILPTDKKIKLNVIKDEVKFEFLLLLRLQSNKALVMGSGAFNREKIESLIFNRHKWIDDIEESTILYNDPTLYLDDKINIGWAYGSKGSHYIKEIGDILKVIYKKAEINPNRVLYFGSSAGGFTSLMLASYMKGRAFVNNTQTNINNYYKTFLDNLKRAVYGDVSHDLDEKRANVVAWFKHNKYVTKIHYSQNLACVHDMQKHFLPFLEQVSKIDSNVFGGRITTYLYSDKERGHDPISNRETMGIIRNIFNSIK